MSTETDRPTSSRPNKAATATTTTTTCAHQQNTIKYDVHVSPPSFATTGNDSEPTWPGPTKQQLHQTAILSFFSREKQ